MVIAVILVLGIGAYLLTQQGADNSATAGQYPSYVIALAQAIATAEGFYVPNTRPAKDHNPGDLTVDINGRGVGKDGSLIIYASDDDGWDALYQQVQKYFNGSSAHAGPDSSIADLSGVYTATEQSSWAANVSNTLGVDPNTSLSDLTGF